MTITYVEVRNRFPNPSCRGDGCTPPEAYCVGGALSLAAGVDWRFPTNYTLSKVLQTKYGLSWEQAQEYAHDIVLANDANLIEVAWGLAKCAIALGNQGLKDAGPRV